MSLLTSPFADRAQRVRDAVARHAANAVAAWQGGAGFGVLLRSQQADGGFGEAVTSAQHTLSLCVVNAPGIAEGSTQLVVGGQACRVTGAVVPDASGWATFPIVFTGAAGA
ncbi:head-tail joining protein [Comamonas aquatica]|uniref:head-tail joining protein n=1 Tax=Comamonas aquatica TaxID=225991 RepID=UPI00244864A8|nr:hypothetical protein [Comamonas aquatica]MDH0371819.1 hypothetical protein [Comamonas aquatica]MDH1815371.1 hypothetical protein [Comamonas aquatica]